MNHLTDKPSKTESSVLALSQALHILAQGFDDLTTATVLAEAADRLESLANKLNNAEAIAGGVPNLRDQFAMAALQALVKKANTTEDCFTIAPAAYSIASAMMEARK